MALNDLYRKQIEEEKEQLEKSLAEIVKIISMLETGVKIYPESTAINLNKFYKEMLKNAQLGKETFEKGIAELGKIIESLK